MKGKEREKKTKNSLMREKAGRTRDRQTGIEERFCSAKKHQTFLAIELVARATNAFSAKPTANGQQLTKRVPHRNRLYTDSNPCFSYRQNARAIDMLAQWTILKKRWTSSMYTCGSSSLPRSQTWMMCPDSKAFCCCFCQLESLILIFSCRLPVNLFYFLAQFFFLTFVSFY